MAGHSKWANIKHRKGRQDAKRSKVWSKCSRAIIVAAKNGGGDPASNLTLRYAIDEAKSHNMPKDTITNAIKKGTGDLEGVTFESLSYEGYGAGGVAIIVDCLTDKRTRTAPEIKKLFEVHGGSLGAPGCVTFMFETKGQIILPKEAGDEEAIMTLALEAGAEDVADEDESWAILTQVADFVSVKDAVDAAGLTVTSAEITKIPGNTVECTGSDAKKVWNLVEAFEDHDDVQKVYANFDISEEELAMICES